MKPIQVVQGLDAIEIQFYNATIQTCRHQLGALVSMIVQRHQYFVEYCIGYRFGLLPMDALDDHPEHSLRFVSCILCCSDQDIVVLLSEIWRKIPDLMSSVSSKFRNYNVGGPMIFA
jgi:hypothetical protein